MKKIEFLGLAVMTTMLSMIAVPMHALGVLQVAGPRLSCSVEATNSIFGTTENKVSYKIYYSSSYSSAASPFTVTARKSSGIAVAVPPALYSQSGKVAVKAGKGYLLFTGKAEQSFTYPIANNDVVTLKATINGAACSPKVLQTKLPQPIPNINLKPNLNLQPDLGGINIPPPQKHTCRVVGEGGARNDGSLLIGTAIRYENIAPNKYQYLVRGFRDSDPTTVREYTGTYTAKVAGSDFVFDPDGKAFFFDFNSSSANENFIITAQLGTVECTRVIIPAPPQPLAVAPAPSEESANGTSSDSSNPVEPPVRVIPEGIGEEERKELAELELLSEKMHAQSAGESSEAESDDAAGTGTDAQDPAQRGGGDNSDYLMYILLALIILALGTIAYSLMRQGNRKMRPPL